MNLDNPIIWVVFFGFTLVTATLFTIFARWALKGPAVPLAKLNRLRVGMTMEEVQALLGKPRAYLASRGGIEWRYGLRMKRYVLILRFGGDNRLHQFVHMTPGESEPRENV